MFKKVILCPRDYRAQVTLNATTTEIFQAIESLQYRQIIFGQGCSTSELLEKDDWELISGAFLNNPIVTSIKLYSFIVILLSNLFDFGLYIKKYYLVPLAGSINFLLLKVSTFQV